MCSGSAAYAKIAESEKGTRFADAFFTNLMVRPE